MPRIPEVQRSDFAIIPLRRLVSQFFTLESLNLGIQFAIPINEMRTFSREAFINVYLSFCGCSFNLHEIQNSGLGLRYTRSCKSFATGRQQRPTTSTANNRILRHEFTSPCAETTALVCSSNSIDRHLKVRLQKLPHQHTFPDREKRIEGCLTHNFYPPSASIIWFRF